MSKSNQAGIEKPREEKITENSNMLEMPEQKITPKVARQKRLARLVVQGKTCKEIGQEVIPHAKWPSQAVSNRVADKGTQREIKAIMPEYTKEMCLAELQAVHNRAITRKQTAVEATIVMDKAKIAGLVVDQVKDLTQPDVNKLSDAAAKSLGMLANSPQSPDDAQGEVKEAEGVKQDGV